MRERKHWTDWLSAAPYGKQLKRLHAWNAWLIGLLAVSGIMLFVPAVRELGEGRSWLKLLHVWFGFVSIFVVILYMPLLRKHWRQLRTRPAQRWNLGWVLVLLAGWIVSGLLLWQLRRISPAWSNAALLVHDALTWIGIPYAVYHAVSRSRWVKASRKAQGFGTAASGGAAADALAAEPQRTAAQAFVESLKNAPISRAAFLRSAAALLLVFGVGPAFYRWLKRVSDTGGTSMDPAILGDENSMLPEPVALPASNPPAGGGAQGQFRIYTVTQFPSFTSDHWKFVLTGLVEQEHTWNWKQFLELKRKVQVSDFHCVTGWSVYKVTWEGIPLSELLRMAKPTEAAKYVKFYSGDKEYTDCLSLRQAEMDDVMVAVMMDGKPIPQKLGGPVRLVVPQMYAYKSVKWLQAIELIDQEHTGYWELRGYDNDAWVPGSRRV
ncbi:Protein-methionine-sulfoxide reductase catalytic subunit MsrP [Paenibacillus solanacearum]|uniref:Protein-methionine-sulfoxide reductase catalytic subunit MsrP n=1 Tax=Paenibacillus solanacearum TaxID=2048548 RepID=A0A916K8X8_9BACL|nr:molybdopterin-dependent oxidoreductase [Paenibacillus solanacearum]CAG7650631.1 Protein-methionine-sulfoxide reductase catalytic subunit MsrP [Paenibacillus solanacearum]